MIILFQKGPGTRREEQGGKFSLKEHFSERNAVLTNARPLLFFFCHVCMQILIIILVCVVFGGLFNILAS